MLAYIIWMPEIVLECWDIKQGPLRMICDIKQFMKFSYFN